MLSGSSLNIDHIFQPALKLTKISERNNYYIAWKNFQTESHENEQDVLEITDGQISVGLELHKPKKKDCRE